MNAEKHNNPGYFVVLMKVTVVFFNLQGLLCYWFASNCISLTQALFVKIPNVRQALSIPTMVYQKPDPATKKTVVQTVKDSKFFLLYG